MMYLLNSKNTDDNHLAPSSYACLGLQHPSLQGCQFILGLELQRAAASLRHRALQTVLHCNS